MIAGTQVSEWEYLHTDYQPDCEFADGVLIERNVGTKDHSWLQTRLAGFFLNRRKAWGIDVYVEQRIRLRPGRYMIPDVCVIAGDAPKEQVFTAPPLLWVEILSPEDRTIRMNRKVREVLDFGVPYVWVIDPETMESDLHTPSGNHALEDGILRIEGTPIEVPLKALEEQ